MEKIDVFGYIDKACATLNENAAGFSRAADKITEYLQSAFGGIDATVGVTSRIKTVDSLKEKILRNSLYKEFPAERLVFEMHDIIGVKLECRFFKDEEFLYKKICDTFDVDLGDGYFSPSGKKTIKLKLASIQPEQQKNGFSIYRIDGAVVYANENYNFELQIKSLVNSFWSEIEHKLIYKNSRYNQFDSLMKDLLNSIHESLTGVDHQLNIIFDRFTGNSFNNQQSQIENIFAMGLNEIYTAIVKQNTGISVSITEYSEAIVKYLLTNSSYTRQQEGLVKRLSSIASPEIAKFAKQLLDQVSDDDDDDADGQYSGVLLSLMEWMKNVDYSSIAIGDKIELHPKITENTEVAKVFLDNINTDFYLNTFFHIFFSLERGNDDEDFADYIAYYGGRIFNGKTQEQRYRTLAALCEVDAHKLPLEETITALEQIA